jgi:hypothetical protein
VILKMDWNLIPTTLLWSMVAAFFKVYLHNPTDGVVRRNTKIGSILLVCHVVRLHNFHQYLSDCVNTT